MSETKKGKSLELLVDEITELRGVPHIVRYEPDDQPRLCMFAAVGDMPTVLGPCRSRADLARECGAFLLGYKMRGTDGA